MFLKSLIVIPFLFVVVCNFQYVLFSSPTLQNEILDREKVIRNEYGVMKNKALQFINEGLNKGQIELLDTLLSDQFEGRYCDRSTPQCIVKQLNRNQLKQAVKKIHTNTPGYHLTIESMQVENETVTVHWEGKISEKGLPINISIGEKDYKEKVQQKGTLKIKFENGLIHSYRIWDYFRKRPTNNLSVNNMIALIL